MPQLRDLITAPPDGTSRTAYIPVTFPAGLAPTYVPDNRLPTDPLPKVQEVVIPWTAAEKAATADVLTPGKPYADFTDYTHLWSDYAPKISHYAPAWEAQRLGNYAQFTVGDRTCLLFGPELHFSQDGPDMPIADLYAQIIEETGCEWITTTGTAGGVGATTLLGDVVVGDYVQADFQKDFAKLSWAHTRYKCTEFTNTMLPTVIKMLPVNAARLPDGGSSVITGDILTTDFFGWDDAENTFGLRTYNPWARAVEMGDAVLGYVIAGMGAKAPSWRAIRCASDPQMPKMATLSDEDDAAGKIYIDWGGVAQYGASEVVWSEIAARAS